MSNPVGPPRRRSVNPFELAGLAFVILLTMNALVYAFIGPLIAWLWGLVT